MRVMPSNQTGERLRSLEAEYPGHLAHLFSPGETGWRTPSLPYALDNGAWIAYKNGERWKQREFLGLCERAATHQTAGGRGPEWLLAPDVVADRDGTLRAWECWERDLARWYSWPLAFAVQDGMTSADVPTHAAVIFVGGSTAWKRRTFRQWAADFPRVHVGRINTYGWLWACAESRVESIDGTGWFYENEHQAGGLVRFLSEWKAGHRRRPHGPLFEAPCAST